MSEPMTKLTDDTMARYTEVKGLLSTAKREQVSEMVGKAFAYGWGWVDAGGTRPSADRYDSFPYAYGIVWGLAELGRISHTPALREAFENWSQYAEIRDYNGRDLVTVSPMIPKAASLRKGDRVGDRTVLWIMSPMRPGAHTLLPDGGALVTYTDNTQEGFGPDADVPSA